MEAQNLSFFNRLLGKPRPVWITAVICLVLLALPLLAITLDQDWARAMQMGYLRPLMVPSVVIGYVFVVAPPLHRTQASVLRAIRTLVPGDDAAFHRLVEENTRIDSRKEWITFVIGLTIGAFLAISVFSSLNRSAVSIYYVISMSAMFGVLALVVYGSFTDTRLNAALHRQPLHIDIFDTRPFEAIGRQSLLISLVFIGGITLSLILGISPESINSWEVWTFYAVILLIPIILFFANMRDTHRVLSREKQRVLDAAQEKIRSLQRQMRQVINDDQGLGELAREYTAMLAYEARLKSIQTWPYDAPMLRTLFLAVLIPLVQRVISEIVSMLY